MQYRNVVQERLPQSACAARATKSTLWAFAGRIVRVSRLPGSDKKYYSRTMEYPKMVLQWESRPACRMCGVWSYRMLELELNDGEKLCEQVSTPA